MVNYNELYQQFRLNHKGMQCAIRDFASQMRHCDNATMLRRHSLHSWDSKLIESVRRYALRPDSNKTYVDDDDFITRWVFEEMGRFDHSPSTAVGLLIRTGHFSIHENIDLLKSRFRPYTDETSSQFELDDVNKHCRIDLSHLRSYAIDPDNAEELDDALSVEKLENGRVKVWIHIADPTSIVPLNSVVDIEARKRGQTVYLPSRTSYMFPTNLAIDTMSFRHGKKSLALSISVVLNEDGSFDRDSHLVEFSTIRVDTLTYGEADKIMADNVGDATLEDLNLLLAASNTRAAWRESRKSHTTCSDDSVEGKPFVESYRDIMVTVMDVDGEALITTTKSGVDEIKSPSHVIVDEMMLLCGHVVACLGINYEIPLPFRIPRGYVFEPEPRFDLGLEEGYVRCTSPIRRYIDCLVHHQLRSYVKMETFMPPSMIRTLGQSVDCEHKANILISKEKRYWVCELFRRGHLEGKTYWGRVLWSRSYRPDYGSLQSKAKVRILYDTVAYYDTTVDNIPITVDVRVEAVIPLVVTVADPRANCLEFRYSFTLSHA